MEDLKLALAQGDPEAIGEAVRRLPDISEAVEALKRSGVYLVQEACKLGCLDVLQDLIDDGVDVTCTDGAESPMQVACSHNQLDIIDLLLAHGCPILPDKVLAWHQASPLYIASRHGHIKVIQKLIDHSPGLVKDEDVRGCLFYAACRGGHTRTMRMWITPSMDLNHPLKLVENVADFHDCEKLTPLYAACSNGHEHVIRDLLESFMNLDFTATVCNSFPDIIGKVMKEFFVPMEKAAEEDDDDIFQLVSGQLKDKRLSVLHASWLLPYTVTLVELNVSENNLTELPDCLPWRFQNLRTFSAMKNKIQCIMPPLSSRSGDRQSYEEEEHCPSLEEMNLSHNSLESVCEEVFQIPSLTTLNLSHNKLQYLVRCIHLDPVRSTELQPGHRLEPTESAKRNSTLPKKWNVPALTNLDISHNKLQMLPEEITDCSALSRFDVSNNCLAFMQQPWDCPMGYLDFSHNELERFPVSAEQYWCGSLRYLNLSYNKLEEINEGVVKLNVLVDLNLSHNKIIQLPDPELWDCSHLHQLDLKHNKLGVPQESTPTKFRSQTSFPRFTKKPRKPGQDDQKDAIEFPDVLSSCLKELRLAYNNLDNVPLSLCNLKMLEVLDLSHNPLIKTLPKEMGRLKNCGMLKLKGLLLDNIKPEVIADKTNRTREILDGFLESLQSCKPYRKIKTVVLGKKDKGKTTLVNILADKKGQIIAKQGSIGCREVVLHRRKGSFPFKGEKRPDITLRVWDVPGDEAYNLIQHSLYTPYTLYILVWDFWSIGDELDKIGQLLYNIQACTPNFSVVIVGTFLDKVVSLKSSEKEEALENLQVKIGRKLNNLPDIPLVCPVSCATNDGFEILRNVLYEKACAMKLPGRKGGPVVERKVPQNYLTLETRLGDFVRELREAGGPLCLNQKELSELIEGDRECADLLVPEEFTSVTKFLVETGTLLHFSDQLGALNTLYFLDPAWLCDILTHPLVSSKGRELLRHGSGKLQRSQVRSLYMGDLRFPANFLDQYIELLERFEIAVSISNAMLFFPSQLPESSPLTSEQKVDHRKKLCRLYRMAECPISFWLRLLTRMMTRVERLCEADWFHRPAMTSTIRVLSNKNITRNTNKTGSFHGLQIRESTKIYCRQLIFVQHQQGSFKVEPISFTGEDNENRLHKGVLITEVDQTEKFGIIGIIVDEIEDIIQDYYPGLLEPDESTMMPRLERYAVCSTCFPDLPPSCDMDVDHFTMEHCARMLVHDNSIRCPTGIKHDLEKLVPDFLMKELPSRFFLDMGHLDLQETKENFLGGGVTGSVFKAKYDGRFIAVKVYRSDIRNNRDQFGTSAGFSQSSDSGTATMSTMGSSTGVEIEEEEETEYMNYAKEDRRCMIDMDETESIKAFRALREMRQEVALTSRLQHPCIVALIGLGFSPKLMMALELAPMGSLRDLLDKYSETRPPFNKYRDKDKAFPPLFSKALTFKFVYQIARGLNYLHTSGIIYKDLKSDNILTMSEDPRDPVNLKLSDYGISKYSFSGRSFGLVGTPGYQAPEILDSLAYDEKVDIFSLAMVIYEILTGKRPYMEYENLGQITRAIRTEDKRPRVEDFNVHTQFPYLEDIMQKCWQSHASGRPSASLIVSQRCMQNIHFLSQSSTLKMVERDTFKTDCVLGTGGGGKKPLLWIWDGCGLDRTCSILDVERSCARVFKKNFDGPRVLCMACVGKNAWVGTEHCQIEVYRSEAAGPLTQCSSFSLDAAPVQMITVHNNKDVGPTVYVALENANLLQFKSQTVRPRVEHERRTVRRIEGYMDNQTVVLRSDKIHCMTLANDSGKLWVSNSGHLDIVDCSDFKVVRAQRINLEILYRLTGIKIHAEVIQMVEVNGLVFGLLKDSCTVLEFDSNTYNFVGILSLKGQSLHSKIVFRPITLMQQDHDVYHGVDSQSSKSRRSVRPSTSSVDSDSDDEVKPAVSVIQESFSDAPVIPPRVPARGGATGVLLNNSSGDNYGPPVPPKRSNTNIMRRRPAIPSKPRLSDAAQTLPIKKSEPREDDIIPKSKLKTLSSQSLPNISTHSTEGISVTSIANVRGSLWVGRSSGDICIVDVTKPPEVQSKACAEDGTTTKDSQAESQENSSGSTHGTVVAQLYDANHRKRGDIDKVELLTVGNYVASVYKAIGVQGGNSSSLVELASWDAYNAGDAGTVEQYWKHLLRMEKRLIEEGGGGDYRNMGEF